MTKSSHVFGQSAGNPALALAELRAAETLLHFIAQGFRDAYGAGPRARLESFGLLVKNKLLEQAAGGGLVPSIERLQDTWKAGAWNQALKAATRAYLEAHLEMAPMYFGRIAPPWLALISEAKETALAVSVVGQAPVSAPALEAPVEQAYAIAQYNQLRCEQRLTALYVLANTIRVPSRSDIPNVAAQEELTVAARDLWVQRAMHVSRVLAFGSLLGGEYLEKNKALVKAMYGEGMSVMELLEIDGQHPGRWSASAEDALRQAIAHA